ncbi:GL10103 [Drosophila persimilis]|uniref:GL10103 n=1 Tax=Drosophila persimilis TaxID=7234 RepID=B4H574_DROPE|nr:GL10103 [Drosophila persimilis]
MDNLGAMLLTLCLLGLLIFLLRVLMITFRSYTMSQRLKDEPDKLPATKQNGKQSRNHNQP